MEAPTEVVENIELTEIKPSTSHVESIQPDFELEDREHVCVRPSTSGFPEALYHKSEKPDRLSLQLSPQSAPCRLLSAEERAVAHLSFVRYPGEDGFLGDEFPMRLSGNISGHQNELNITLFKRLKLSKRTHTWLPYAVFASNASYSAVERFFILDVIQLILSVAALLYGVSMLDGCNAKKLVPVLTVVSGFLGIVANFCNAMRVLCYCDDGFNNYHIFIRLTRFSLFIIDFYGMCEVGSMYPPQYEYQNCVTFCSSNLYWFSFSYFTYEMVVHIIIITIILISILYFFV